MKSQKTEREREKERERKREREIFLFTDRHDNSKNRHKNQLNRQFLRNIVSNT